MKSTPCSPATTNNMKDTYTMPAAPATLIRRLNAAGFEAYAVGGCVRDTLLGLIPDDWDITTSALPQETAHVFADCHVIETGLQHGTITVRFEGKNYEITTFRVDGDYTDNRHPDRVTFTPNAEEDVKRRDFTINAMLWHPDSGIHDFVGGMADLQNNVLRCVGEPKRRFSEDALRILRALRFAAVYGFAVQPETRCAAVQLADTLCAVSAERIRVELFKLLCGAHAAGILDVFANVIREVLPEVTLTAQMLQTLDRAPRDLVCRLAVLLQKTDAAAVLRRLKTDNATIAQVDFVLQTVRLSPTTDPIALKKLLRLYSPKTLQRSINFHIALGKDIPAWKATASALEALLSTNPCYSLEKLQISGKDILSFGLKGKEIGMMLDCVLTAVIEETCENERDALLTFVKIQTRK